MAAPPPLFTPVTLTPLAPAPPPPLAPLTVQARGGASTRASPTPRRRRLGTGRRGGGARGAPATMRSGLQPYGAWAATLRAQAKGGGAWGAPVHVNRGCNRREQRLPPRKWREALSAEALRRACSPLLCTIARPTGDCRSEASIEGACWCVKCWGKPLKVQPCGTARLMASWNSVPPTALAEYGDGVGVGAGAGVRTGDGVRVGGRGQGLGPGPGSGRGSGPGSGSGACSGVRRAHLPVSRSVSYEERAGASR